MDEIILQQFVEEVEPFECWRGLQWIVDEYVDWIYLIALLDSISQVEFQFH